MSVKTDFLQSFSEQLTLPPRLEGYAVERCIRRKEGRTLWILRREIDGAQFLLRVEEDWPALRESFLILSRAAAALPGAVPQPVDCFFCEGRGWLLRSWLPGQTLEQWRRARGGCSDAQCAAIGKQLCELLDVLHRLEPPVIHRDVKPENIIISPQGQPQLIDFGIAREYRPGAERDTRVMGTEGTAAPEQYGCAQTDARTDLYSLGMTLLWLRSGSLDRAGLAHMGPKLRRVLERATDFAPDRRYASAAEMARALERRPVSRLAVELPLAALSVALCAALLWTASQKNQSERQLTAALTQTEAELTARLDVTEERLSAVLEEQARREETVQFASVSLEAAVRAELGMPEGDITRQNLERVERLALAGEQVIDRTQNFFYMGCANLDGEVLPTEAQGDLRDLSLLAEMPNLKELILCNQPLTELSPLAGLPIERLIVGGCPVGDCAVLGTLSALRELLLDSGGAAPLQLTGLEELANVPLTTLSLHQVQTDWTALEALDGVWSLSLIAPDAAALTALPGMDSLRSLDFTGYPEGNLYALNLPELDTLILRVSTMTLDGAEKLEKLGTLSLVNCPVTDLAPLQALSRLVSINLDGPPLDYTQLQALPALQYVRIAPQYQEQARQACPDAGFQWVE